MHPSVAVRPLPVWMLTTLAAALGAALLLAGCGRTDETPPEAPRPVQTTVAARTAVAGEATWAGTVRARYESRLGFEAGGRVIARLVDVGSRVRRGQPLMRVDPAQELLHLEAASADVDAAQRRVEQDRLDLQRGEQLLARQFASQAEVDQQRLALAQSQSQWRAAVAQQALRRNQHAYTELRADRDGIVTAIGAETGQVVGAGQAVVTVAADGEREVLVSVPESRVDELRRSARLQVRVWAQPGRRWSGRLRELAPDADAVSRTYAARISVDDPDAALMLGMTATVQAREAGSTEAVQLPLAAIHDRDGQPRVWVVNAASATVHARPVRLGEPLRDAVLVTEGLAGGETVVTAGVNQLHEGQAVQRLEGVSP